VGAANLLQGRGPNVGHTGLTPTAAVAVGARSVRVTAGGGAGTNAPANTYAGGLLYVSLGAATGVNYSVKSHEEIVAAQPFTIVLESDDLIWFPIAVTDRVSLIANPYLDVVPSVGTAATAGVVGVSVGTGLNPGVWGYVQVEGLAVLKAEGAIAVGQAVSPSITAVSAVAINAGTLPIIGSAVTASVALGDAIVISLNLP
jgi:hypothetical protein